MNVGLGKWNSERGFGIIDAKKGCMRPFKRYQYGRLIDFIQWVGLVLLICFTYHHFGPESNTPITLPVIGIFGAAVFLLLGPIPLKFKE